MKERILYYIRLYSHYGPFSSPQDIRLTIAVTAGILILCFLIQILTKKSVKDYFFQCMTLWYLYVLFSFTVFSRNTSPDYAYQGYLLWSYQELLETGKLYLVFQIVMNCCMLIPLGFLMPFSCPWTRTFSGTVVTGMAVSGAVETMQLFMKRGLFEWDDIVHNVIGMIAGYGIYAMFDSRRPWWQRILAVLCEIPIGMVAYILAKIKGWI